MKQLLYSVTKNTWISLVLLMIVLGSFLVLSREQEVDVTTACVNHQNYAMHIHPHLRIMIDQAAEKIPANIGIVSAACMRPLHTHDNTGTLHIEWTRERDFTLGEFFNVWGKSFTQEEILGNRVDADHILRMTVNGAPTTDFGNVIVRDGDRIEIRYETK